MARPPFRHIHRAGAWTNPNQHSLGGCSLQLAVTAAVCTVCRRQVKCVCQWWSESGAPSHGLQVRPTLCMPCAQRHFPSPCVRNPLEEIANSAPSAQAMACVVKDTFFFRGQENYNLGTLLVLVLLHFIHFIHLQLRAERRCDLQSDSWAQLQVQGTARESDGRAQARAQEEAEGRAGADAAIISQQGG